MAITANRIGSAPITLDWTQLASTPVRSSTGASKIYQPAEDDLQEPWQTLKQRFVSGEVGFYDSPVQDDISQCEASQGLARDILADSRITDCLFLGIGGSALGPISLLDALKQKTNGRLRFHFVENVDPVHWSQTLAALSPASTLVCAVTKSGGTYETISQMLAALQWLGQERWATHFVAITDPAKGDLRKFVEFMGLERRTLSIHPSLGGRFSVFSPVGIFPAALAGLSVADFLKGASQVRDAMEKTPVAKNALLILGAHLVRHYPQRDTHVCMPYSTPLRQIGNWWVQLWGESLGKAGKGFNPIAAVGATDQHSLLQLLNEGPDDKVTLFMTLDENGPPVAIPALELKKDGKRMPLLDSFALLQGHTLNELLSVEYQATSYVLSRLGRPHVTFRLDRLDERTLGALYFAFAVLTAYTGTLWDVNPFDQPGVEEGKVKIRQLLEQTRAGDRVGGEDDRGRESALERLRLRGEE